MRAMENSNLEIRSTKQIKMTQIQNHKLRDHEEFEKFEFLILDLFRISSFGFRAYAIWQGNALSSWYWWLSQGVHDHAHETGIRR